MNKYLHTFESYGSLDMPVNPGFTSYNSYKQYEHIPGIKSYINQLNNLWWDMESGEEAGDEHANYYAEELERAENELKAAIQEYDANGQTDVDEFDEMIQSQSAQNMIDDFSEVMETLDANFKIISQEVDDYSSSFNDYFSIQLTIELDDEEYDVKVDEDGNVELTDFDITANMGNVHSRDNMNDVATKFKTLLSMYGDDYIKFLNDNSITR